MRRLLAPLALVVALAGASAPAATARQATPTAGCVAGPASPMAPVLTVNEEIAGELDQLFRCLAVRDWDEVERVVAIPDGSVDPFAALRALDETGLVSFAARLEAQMVRSTGPEGPTVDVAWRLDGQVRSERWTFRRPDRATGDAPWSLTAVEAGVPRYDGAVVGITGMIAAGGVSLSRARLVTPGGIELRLDVAHDVEPGMMVVVVPLDACGRAEPSPLTAFAQVTGTSVTIALDDPPDGAYALSLVSTLASISRETICAAPTAALEVLS